MEIKLNKEKILLLIIFTIVAKVLLAQIQSNVVNIDSISINKLKYSNSMNDVYKIFGDPVSYKDVKITDGPEGVDELFIFKYDSIEIRYVKGGTYTYLAQINIDGSNYNVCIGKAKINIGDSIEKLIKAFPLSYAAFNKFYEKHHNQKVQEFNILIKFENDYGSYYRNLKIILKNGTITQIRFAFETA